MRIALGIEYDGSQFYGWQYQEGLRTIQGCLEHALGQVANHPISICCAGRTDAGVHATGQIVHFDTTAERSERSWVFGTNTHLPKEIVVQWAKIVPDDFHARFSAIARRYRYYLYNSPVRPGLLRDKVSWCYRPLQIARMQEAGQFLIGEHDFSSFRASYCQSKSPVRHLHHIHIECKQQLIIFDVKANAFLHHMIRNMVGVLTAIGSGFKEVSWAHEVLLAQDRRYAGMTASPDGLYLVEVMYPEKFALPNAFNTPFFD